ncbi:inner centromere protein A isoform X2 [Cherax quadricarinatus]|uniref:inner centromere protein A isoform X2 n=1 Tax=Cherax quadricarinatus TaxID=27406 RepID=UPI0023784FAF|nr:inner centromere protein A-like isoform X2 [Cherax quadricarinatus]
MAAVDHLFELYLTAQKKIAECNNNFEEHFAWLEEVVRTARRTFATSDLALLPKTPRGKKKAHQKRPHQPDTIEESPQAKKSSQGSTQTSNDAQSPIQEPRRLRRAASRVAQEKTRRDVLMDSKCKLRRPTTPEALSTCKKKTGKKQAVHYVDSDESFSCTEYKRGEKKTSVRQNPDKTSVSQIERGIDCDPKHDPASSRSTPDEEEECVSRLGDPASDPVLSRDVPEKERESDAVLPPGTPKRKSRNTSRLSVCLKFESVTSVDLGEATKRPQGGKLSVGKFAQDTSVSVCQEEVVEEACVPEDDCTYSELRLEDSDGDDKSESEKERNIHEPNKEMETSKENRKSIHLGKTAQSVCEQPEKLDEECKSQSQDLKEVTQALPNFSSQFVQPLPSVRTTRTKLRELQSASEDDSDKCNKRVDLSTPPHPVPKPRSTRTKQKKEPESHIISDDSDDVMLPPKIVPNSRVTRSKLRVIKDRINSVKGGLDSQISSEDRSDESEEASSQHGGEISLSSSTHTKTRMTEESCDGKHFSDGMSSSDSQSTKTSQTRKRQVENTPEQSTGSTRTKRKKVNELTENEIVNHSHSLRLTLSESEDDKSVPGPVEMNSTFVRVDSHDVLKKILNKSDESSELTSSETSKSVQSTMFKHINAPVSVTAVKSNEKSECSPVRRITRSKVRQLPVAKPSPNRPSPSQCIGKAITPKTPVLSSFANIGCMSNAQRGATRGLAVQHKGVLVKSPVKPAAQPFVISDNSPALKLPVITEQDSTREDSSTTGHSVRSLAAAYQNHIGETPNETEELTSEVCQVTNSPARVTRHLQSKAFKRESSTRRCARKSLKRAVEIARIADFKRSIELKSPESHGVRINPPARTPSPICPSEKVVRPNMHRMLGSNNSTFGSSGRITPKTYSKIRQLCLTSSSSGEQNKTLKKIGNTPNEGKRAGNIVSGLSSFIKVQPAKPSREELEEIRQIELAKRREREDETRKKKEELMKLRVEEKKRQNEIRMKRVQEAREERERKAVEAKEQQERERKIREERQKEEQQRKKQQLLAKKRAEEEAKLRKIREQREEERQKQEEETKRLMEEEKRAEEERKQEEKRAHLAEQRRLQEEEKKRRIAEVERIFREKKELERLRLREAERVPEKNQNKISPTAAPKAALNDTYTATDNKENGGLNSTFTKLLDVNQSNYTCATATKNTKTRKKDPSENNYCIDDMKSDDSTDEESKPRKKVPSWATKPELTYSVINQEHYPPVIEEIFPPSVLLLVPDLTKMFDKQRRRFFKRTSSAVWNTPPSKYFESC